MKTLTPAPALPPPMAAWEKVTVGLLGVAVIAVVFVAKTELADRRETAATLSGQRLREIEQAKADGARLVRESDFAVERLTAAAAGTRPESRGTADVASVPAGVDPAARIAALGQVIDLMQKNVLTTTSTGLLLNQAAKPGQALPAFMIDAEGRLAPGFGNLFGLNADEVERFQSIVLGLKQRAEELVTAHTTIRPTENGYVLEYKPPGEAGQFRESVVESLKSYLGDERYRMFATLNGERAAENGTRTGGPGAMFNAMGGAARTVTLTRTPTGLSYSLTGEAGGGGGSVSGANLAPMMTRLGPAARLIPPEFLNSIPKPPAGGAGIGRVEGDSFAVPRTGDAPKTLDVPAGNARQADKF